MATNYNRTIWFPKDSLLGVLAGIPLLGIGGVIWGLLMALFLSGSVIVWLILGLLWGATMWIFYTLFVVILCREVSANIPLQESVTLPERLAKAVKRLRYTVEQQSSTQFVCKPKRGFARFFAFNQLHVRLLDNSLNLTGPSLVVNKVRKQFLEDTEASVSRTAPES